MALHTDRNEMRERIIRKRVKMCLQVVAGEMDECRMLSLHLSGDV